MKMLDRAEPESLFPGGPEVVVLRVEDVIGLKIQAMANAPHRRSHDMADIQRLVEVHRDSIDWELIEDYCALFDMTDMAEKLKAGEWQG